MILLENYAKYWRKSKYQFQTNSCKQQIWDKRGFAVVLGSKPNKGRQKLQKGGEKSIKNILCKYWLLSPQEDVKIQYLAVHANDLYVINQVGFMPMMQD